MLPHSALSELSRRPGAPLPLGHESKVTAYTDRNCEGDAVDAGTIPMDSHDGPCKEILFRVRFDSSSFGGGAPTLRVSERVIRLVLTVPLSIEYSEGRRKCIC